MLYIIGLGLCSSDVSQRALELVRESSGSYIERYTSFIPESTIELIKAASPSGVTELSRQDLEDGVDGFVSKAAGTDISLLVGGDPLVATTHKVILNAAAKRGIKTSMLHAPSILSAAIGESGLDFYRFGQIITIPRWSEHYKPISFFDIIEGNAKRNLHTMLLLDYDGPSGSSLQPEEAAETLVNAAQQHKSDLVGWDTKMLLLHNIALDGKVIRYAKLGELKDIKFSNGPTLMMMPAKLADIESETLLNVAT